MKLVFIYVFLFFIAKKLRFTTDIKNIAYSKGKLKKIICKVYLVNKNIFLNKGQQDYL